VASTSSVVFATTPVLGVDLDAKSSAQAFKLLTAVDATDGRRHIYVRASEALGSADTIKIGAAGSASSDSGSAGWSVDTTGGVAVGQAFWAKRTAIN